MNGGSSLENKFGNLFGSKFGTAAAPLPPTTGGAMYGPYGSPSYMGGSPIIGGSTLLGGGNPLSGFMTPELEHKTSVILPLAGAALLGKFELLFYKI